MPLAVLRLCDHETVIFVITEAESIVSRAINCDSRGLGFNSERLNTGVCIGGAYGDECVGCKLLVGRSGKCRRSDSGLLVSDRLCATIALYFP